MTRGRDASRVAMDCDGHRAGRRRAAGFTLLEMLVVLVLTGMVTGLLMSSLRQVLDLQSRFGIEVFNNQQGAMQATWFRDTVNATVPDQDDGAHRFRGERRSVAGLTLAPLDAADGALLPFTWRLRFEPRRGETVLQYGDRDDAPAIMSWPGDSGRFQFVDGEGRLHDTWPPFLGQWPQLPAAVRLDTGEGDTARVIVAAPRGPTTLLPRLKDLSA
jgi:prepilin-type N-terminal cleavage/methylation domain-containing protein